DHSWRNGAAILGFGNSDESTTLAKTNAGGSAIITYYFRKHINVTNSPDPNYGSLLVVRDDAEVVYLNGEEIGRANLPLANILYSTLPVTNVFKGLFGSPNEARDQFVLPHGALTNGANVVAVEIHQAAT